MFEDNPLYRTQQMPYAKIKEKKQENYFLGICYSEFCISLVRNAVTMLEWTVLGSPAIFQRRSEVNLWMSWTTDQIIWWPASFNHRCGSNKIMYIYIYIHTYLTIIYLAHVQNHLHHHLPVFTVDCLLCNLIFTYMFFRNWMLAMPMAVPPRLMTVAASLKGQRGAHLVSDSDCYKKVNRRLAVSFWSLVLGMSITVQNEYDLHTTKNTGNKTALSFKCGFKLPSPKMGD
jgi:hypothetical protein